MSHDTQKKAVSLNFVGEGKREVRVGYVIENPIWKTSYRLVLGKEKEDKPFLQGWAVVENATDEDWKDVRMALVSGRPICFQMDLYTPLYVPRPTVVPELFASLRPVTYNDDLNTSRDDAGRLDGVRPAQERQGQLRQSPTQGRSERRTCLPADRAARRQVRRAAPQATSARTMDLGGSGVSTMATATKLGDFFQYAIDKPVTLPRQKSALLPIVNKDVQGERVQHLQRAHPGQVPPAGTQVQEHQRPAPDARPDHGL